MNLALLSSPPDMLDVARFAIHCPLPLPAPLSNVRRNHEQMCLRISNACADFPFLCRPFSLKFFCFLAYYNRRATVVISQYDAHVLTT